MLWWRLHLHPVQAHKALCFIENFCYILINSGGEFSSWPTNLGHFQSNPFCCVSGSWIRVLRDWSLPAISFALSYQLSSNSSLSETTSVRVVRLFHRDNHGTKANCFTFHHVWSKDFAGHSILPYLSLSPDEIVWDLQEQAFVRTFSPSFWRRHCLYTN